MKDILSILNEPVRMQEIFDPVMEEKRIRLFILRLDEIDLIISGNKLFKLFYFLQQALSSHHQTILTFGGAYSNHLAATAAACASLKLNSIGIVRGYRPAILSHTLKKCEDEGMKIYFLPAKIYRNQNEMEFIESLHKEYGQFILVPEGGACITGKLGAEKITALVEGKNFTHACCALGTGTTAAGLSALRHQGTTILTFPVLKGITDLEMRMRNLLPGEILDGYEFMNEYHFGGYAKKTTELLNFMNNFYRKHGIPTDFVYTAKMFFGVWDLLYKDYFPFNSKILCLHTGGLQGNLSLPENTLSF